MYYFSCADLDLDCDWDEYADTRSDLLDKITQHLKEDHEMTPISKKLLNKIKDAIQEIEEEEEDWEEIEEEEEEEEEEEKERDDEDW